MRAGVVKGRTLFRRQTYAIRSITADDEKAVLEVDWSGELAVAVGSLTPGRTMRADCAVFFEMRGDRIAKLRH
jgi:ketosteroid isomerase-like protein